MKEKASSLKTGAASAHGTAPSPSVSAGPLFYRKPVLLSSQLHGEWRLRGGDFAFAAKANAVPLMISEFVMASRSYPIVFAAGDAAPLVLLGLERNNLFLSDGQWSEGHYIPAYIRRYPFVFTRIESPEGFALAIDADSDRVLQGGEEGVLLFQGDALSATTEQALEFCRLFAGEHRATQAFGAALRSHGLLAARGADVTLPGGRKLALTGFEVVDADKFVALPEETVVDWHRRGWLALVSFHLSSLRGFADLLSRQGLREASRSAARPKNSPSKRET